MHRNFLFDQKKKIYIYIGESGYDCNSTGDMIKQFHSQMDMMPLSNIHCS